ncbi:MAG: TonB-dependent receptor [Caulobacteraceae bacterium]|nr:TonB-dependent receptor [Caulobacteraceae bacterium]
MLTTPAKRRRTNRKVSTSYEIGTRTDWLDGRLTANFTVFHTIFEDFQARVGGTVIDPGTMLPSPELTVINAGELEIKGAELELNYHPIDPLRLDAQIGYLHAQYNEFADSRFRRVAAARSKRRRSRRNGRRASVVPTPSNSQMTLRSCWPVQRAIAQRWRLLSTAR